MANPLQRTAGPASTLPPEELNAAARTALSARRYDEALTFLDRRLAIAPEDVDALCLSALAYWRRGGAPDAVGAVLERARALRPGDPRVLTLSAEFFLHTGQPENAWALAEMAVGESPGHAPAYVVLARTDAARIDHALLSRMRQLAEQRGIRTRWLRSLHNAIGRVLEARGDIDDAFRHFVLSNRLSPIAYDAAEREARFEEASATFDRDFFRDRRAFGREGTGCVFIVGMPRSGSTLLERMLVAHPDVDSCGESDALSDIALAFRRRAEEGGHFQHLRKIGAGEIAEAAGAYLTLTSRQMHKPAPHRRIDKRLGNFLHLPLALLMFPDARLLHAHRHPLDVCLSCFTQDFDGHAYANDLGDLAHYYLLYRQYMRLWAELFPGRIHHCRHETMLDGVETEGHRILAALGLDWHPDCAEPHWQRRPAATASAAQVLEPVSRLRVGRWRKYEKHLQPLINGLGGLDAIDRLDRELA